MVSEFWNFLVAVFWHWQSWAGGSGFGGAVVVLIGLYERLTGHVMGKRMYVTVVIVAFLFGAFFMAWRDQYHGRLTAEDSLTKLKKDSTPELVGEIRVIEIAPWPGDHSNSIVIVDASIKNLGAPSFVDSFIVTIKVGGKSVQGLQIPAPSEGIIARHPGGGESIHHAADYLPKKGLETIGKYGATEGFYSVMVPNVSPEELIAGQAVIVLFYKDATGKS